MAKKPASRKKDKEEIEAKGKEYSPQEIAYLNDVKRSHRIQRLQALCNKFSFGMRVCRKILVNSPDNSLYLIPSVKRGKVEMVHIGVSEYPTILILWDGDLVAVPEQPHLIEEDW
jgi:hypothetical protein